MVRLGKDLGWTFVLAAGLLIHARELPAQTTATGTVSSANNATSKPGSSATSKVRVHHKKAATPVAEVPQTPPPPPTLEQSPPMAPRITYQNGQLSIDAHNSTLS